MKRCCAVLLVVLVCGCGTDTFVTSGITVHPGESIQAAVDAAPPNSIIRVEPGVYRESPGAPTAVIISKDGIQLVGDSTPDRPVVLENAGGQMSGIIVAPADSVVVDPNEEHPGEHPLCGTNGNTIHGFSISGFTVRGFSLFGVYLACGDGFSMTQNLADANLLYGLFPVRSHNGVMSDNEAQNTPLDASLYVGQSDHVTIANNSAHDNVLGIEVENSSDVTVTNNRIFDNTLGLVADIMPGLQKMDQTNVLIADNDVHDNNRANSAPEEEGTSSTPPGTGIVVLGGSMVTVQNNRISNNGFAGVIMAGYCSDPSVSCAGIDVDPNPEHNRIRDNTLAGNGLNPPNDPALKPLAADLVWDGTGMDNCWSGNTPSATQKIVGGGLQLPMCPSS